jgi:hypothetical protein
MARFRPFSRLSLFLLLQLATLIAAFRPLVNNFNASLCYAQHVSKMKQDCNDTETQVCPPDGLGGITNPNRIFLTQAACENLCGDGFGFWDPKDITLRIFLWVVPAIVLIAHFHFPPLPWWNYVAVVCHMLGDPIDTLWSMLVRIETYRYFYRKAAIAGEYKSFRAIATIWSAYDEVGYQDASSHFHSKLDEIRLRNDREHGSFLEMLVEKPEPPSNVSRASTLPLGEQHASRWDKAVGKLRKTFSSETPNPDIEPLYASSEAEARVLLLIEKAAQQLVSNRSESGFATLVAIVGLITAIGGAYVRTWSDRMNNQTAHTIATVTLLFIVIPMVKLSGNIGAFTSATGAVDVLQTLRRELGTDYDLFPAFNFQSTKDAWAPASSPASITQDVGPAAIALETAAKLELWPKMACYAGMNSSFRPMKWSNAVSRKRSLLALAVAIFMVVFGCFMPALLISYYTPLQGYACRSLAWTLVAALWVTSFLANRVFVFLPACREARRLWIFTFTKDGLATAAISFLVICQQIGLYNSCYCRSGAVTAWFRHDAFFHNYVNLNALTDDEWDWGWWNLWLPLPGAAFGLVVLFLVVVEYLHSDSRKLLNRNEEDRQKLARRINDLIIAGTGDGSAEALQVAQSQPVHVVPVAGGASGGLASPSTAVASGSQDYTGLTRRETARRM